MSNIVGQMLCGYRIAGIIEESGSGTLYTAERGTDRALLRVYKGKQAEDKQAERVLAAAAALQRARSPHLLPILGMGRLDGDRVYVLVPQPPGASLATQLTQTPADALCLLRDIASALAACHRAGIAYLDLSPERIAVGRSPTGAPSALLMDSSEATADPEQGLHLSTVVEAGALSPSHRLRFLAPEVLCGGAPVSDRADVYGFGVLAHVLLCGRSPYEGERPGEVLAAHMSSTPASVAQRLPQLTGGLPELLDACLQKQPAQRPTMAQLELALSAAVASPPQAQAQAQTQQLEPPRPNQRGGEPQCIGDYRIVRQLGAGGMGIVYEALSPLQRRVAIKLMHPQREADEGAVERFFSEAQAANVINHPGIISVLHTGRTEQNRRYIVMEYLEGSDLRQLLKRGPLHVSRVCQLGWQLAVALAAAHEKGIVHRDLKPENVMVISDPIIPGGRRTKILDFGIAKVLADTRHLTRTGAVLGTLAYMAPEQLRDAAHVDSKADVYALGMMLHEMVQGTLPYGAAPPSPKLPTPLAFLLARMTDAEPGQRPTMAEAVELLGQAAGQHGASPPGGPSPALSARRAESSMMRGLGQVLRAQGSLLPVLGFVALLCTGALYSWCQRPAPFPPIEPTPLAPLKEGSEPAHGSERRGTLPEPQTEDHEGDDPTWLRPSGKRDPAVSRGRKERGTEGKRRHPDAERAD